MKDLVDMLLGYPTWVKIAVVTLVFTIIILLVFFRPEKQPQENKDREALVAILQLRFETVSNELNSIFEHLEKAGKQNDVQATAEIAKLRVLRERFGKLHEKYLDAVTKGGHTSITRSCP